MPLSARVSDAHTHGVIANGSSDVLIGKMPAATLGSVVAKGSNTVFINKKPAARKGDPTVHGGVVSSGFPRVLIGD